jgi:hypothetical protein
MTDVVVRLGRLTSTSNLIFEIPAQDVSSARVNNAYSRRALRTASVFPNLALSFRNGSQRSSATARIARRPAATDARLLRRHRSALEPIL